MGPERVNLSVGITKGTNVRTIHVQPLSKVDPEIYSNQRATNFIHIQYWHHLIDLVSAYFKRNE